VEETNEKKGERLAVAKAYSSTIITYSISWESPPCKPISHGRIESIPTIYLASRRVTRRPHFTSFKRGERAHRILKKMKEINPRPVARPLAAAVRYGEISSDIFYIGSAPCLKNRRL